LLIGLDGALLLSEQLIMTETLFAFWLILSCVLLVLGVKYQQPVLLNLSGLALGVLTLVRPTGHVLVLSPLLACLLANRPAAGSTRRWSSVASR
jgi:4-amino-4-deoxy-L-arabinose transferase-like glycosyltransferase